MRGSGCVLSQRGRCDDCCKGSCCIGVKPRPLQMARQLLRNDETEALGRPLVDTAVSFFRPGGCKIWRGKSNRKNPNQKKSQFFIDFGRILCYNTKK